MSDVVHDENILAAMQAAPSCAADAYNWGIKDATGMASTPLLRHAVVQEPCAALRYQVGRQVSAPPTDTKPGDRYQEPPQDATDSAKCLR